MNSRCIIILTAAFLLISCPLVFCDNDDYVRQARISYIEGDVSFQHASDPDWSAAAINLPLSPGDRIYTGPAGRTEIEFDDGSILRMDKNTDIEVLALGENLIQLRILVGLSTLSVSGDLDFEINTPAAAFNPLRNGIYRFDVIESGDTDAIVRKGELEAANNAFVKRLRDGEIIHATPNGGNTNISQYNRKDLWDEWCDRRSADLRAYSANSYIPDYVYVGASDLNRHGSWVNLADYGYVWTPSNADASWTPYSVGRWCYLPRYGWTWVSYEPWGWLPYHYGRWHHASFGWCWIPGPSYSFHFWSPGLVAFYSGPNWISWCPLGPGDYYNVNFYFFNRGTYGNYLTDIRRLNLRAPGDYHNRDERGAFRTAGLEHFRNGTFDNRGLNSKWEHVDSPWRSGSLVRERIEITPTRNSYSAAPERQAVRPSHQNTIPPVVRNIPPMSSQAPGRFSRITNPQAATPARIWSDRKENGPENAGTHTRIIERNPNSNAPRNQDERREPIQRQDPSGRQRQDPPNEKARSNPDGYSAPRVIERREESRSPQPQPSENQHTTGSGAPRIERSKEATENAPSRREIKQNNEAPRQTTTPSPGNSSGPSRPSVQNQKERKSDGAVKSEGKQREDKKEEKKEEKKEDSPKERRSQ